MWLFAAMSLAPVGLLMLGAVLGGWTALAAVVFIAAIVGVLDRFIARAAPYVPEAEEFPAADRLLQVIGAAHFIVLTLMIWAIARAELLPGLALFAGAGLWFGQVSNPAAHELIHRPSRGLRALGVAMYSSLAFGHHASAHRLVHHRFVATEDDPNTARRGESFYRFIFRAWPAELISGYRAEQVLQRRLPQGQTRLHPYIWYVSIAVVALCAAFALGGGKGVLIWAALASYAQMQLYLSDYVQHYGLLRGWLPNGRRAPVGPEHSWDATQWASSALMLNAPRHADHHARPNRSYPSLELPPGGLRLPYSLQVMAALALLPPLWFRLMNRRLPPAPRL